MDGGLEGAFKFGFSVFALMFRVAIALFPLWAWLAFMLVGNSIGAFLESKTAGTFLYPLAVRSVPFLRMLGPALSVFVVLGLTQIGAMRGTKWLNISILGVAASICLSWYGEFSRLAYYAEQGWPWVKLLPYFDVAIVWGTFASLGAAFVPFYLGHVMFRAPEGLERGETKIHGDADFANLSDVQREFPDQPGFVLGEALRVDLDASIPRDSKGDLVLFNPKNRATWGQGGKKPLVVFNPRSKVGANSGSGHGVVVAPAGTFKSTTLSTTLTRWPGPVIVNDPAGDLSGKVRGVREAMGKRVYVLKPGNGCGFNVLSLFHPDDPKLISRLDELAALLIGETPKDGKRDPFFEDNARLLVKVILASVVLAKGLPPERRTLLEVWDRVAKNGVELQQDMRDLTDPTNTSIHPSVRRLASSFPDMPDKTWGAVVGTAFSKLEWLESSTLAHLVCGSEIDIMDVLRGDADLFLELQISDLRTSAPRVVIGSIINLVFKIDEPLPQPALIAADEAVTLGFMSCLKELRSQGRKYGLHVVMYYQSLGQMSEQWHGDEGRNQWFADASFVALSGCNDFAAAKQASEMLDSMTAISRSKGTSHGTSGQGAELVDSGRNQGASETVSEVAVKLMTPGQFMRMRSDEHVVFVPGMRPMRLGKAIDFRRPEIMDLLGKSRFAPNK